MTTINSVIHDEQRKNDERVLATLLIFFNLSLLSLFFLICFYQAA
jgi:hypothetical protein